MTPTDGREGLLVPLANGATDDGGFPAGVAPADPTALLLRSASVPLGGAA